MLSNGLETRTTEPPVYASAGTCGAYVRTEAYDGPVTSLTQGPQAVGVALHEPPAGRAGCPQPAAAGAPGTARPTWWGQFMATEQVKKEQGTSHEPPGEGTGPTGGRPVPFTRRNMAGEQVRKEQGSHDEPALPVPLPSDGRGCPRDCGAGEGDSLARSRTRCAPQRVPRVTQFPAWPHLVVERGRRAIPREFSFGQHGDHAGVVGA